MDDWVVFVAIEFCNGEIQHLEIFSTAEARRDWVFARKANFVLDMCEDEKALSLLNDEERRLIGELDPDIFKLPRCTVDRLYSYFTAQCDPFWCIKIYDKKIKK